MSGINLAQLHISYKGNIQECTKTVLFLDRRNVSKENILWDDYITWLADIMRTALYFLWLLPMVTCESLRYNSSAPVMVWSMRL